MILMASIKIFLITHQYHVNQLHLELHRIQLNLLCHLQNEILFEQRFQIL